MKKTILSLCLLLLTAGIASAQHNKHKREIGAIDKQQTVSTPAPAESTPPASSLKPEDMDFKDASHDFGVIPEGPDATCEFTFVNKGKEPIIIQKAQPSCGCTVPSFSSEPIPPGGNGKINVAYHTKGRTSTFNKTISVVSNAGTKMLTIRGNVEKAPTSSVPENNSMIKTN
jgi:hypothetical protein